MTDDGWLPQAATRRPLQAKHGRRLATGLQVRGPQTKAWGEGAAARQMRQNRPDGRPDRRPVSTQTAPHLSGTVRVGLVDQWPEASGQWPVASGFAPFPRRVALAPGASARARARAGAGTGARDGLARHQPRGPEQICMQESQVERAAGRAPSTLHPAARKGKGRRARGRGRRRSRRRCEGRARKRTNGGGRRRGPGSIRSRPCEALAADSWADLTGHRSADCSTYGLRPAACGSGLCWHALSGSDPRVLCSRALCQGRGVVGRLACPVIQ